MRVGDLSGLPAEAIEHFEAEGIDELYPPQAEAVEAGVTDGRSVVASVPTASGKTFVAELAMLSAIRQGGKALYIVPLRALASEKAEQFRAYEAFGISVGISTGNYESDESWLGSRDVIVATSEKVDSLVRNGAGWLADLTCVVADEVHLVDDRNRGPTLEVTLAKIRAISPDVQVVALSATVGNADAVAEWLDAELVDSTWRPIDLKTGVHYGNAINFDDGTQREVPVGKREKQETALVRDIVAEGGSSLVFVNSRRNAEAAARRLAGTVSEFLTDEERESLAAVAEEIREVSDTGTSTDLAAAVEQGAAFHHAGLARGHRSLVEDAFRDRLVKVVSATPTLAAGVNTPSRRVVVRDWRRYDGSYGGMKPLDALEVHQMFGRAGRPGLDDYGEAVLLASDHETAGELFDRYVYADPEPVRSKLAAEPALRTHVLSTVASGFARSREELLDFLDRTLYATQTTEADRLPTVVDTVVEYLSRNEFLERDGETLTATRTGHLVSRLYLDPMSAAELIYGLENAQGVLDSHAGVVADEDADADTAAEAAADEFGLDSYPTALGLFHLVSRTPDMYELYLRSGDRETYTELAYEHEPEFLGDMPTEFEDVAWEDWLSSLKTAKLLDDWAGEEDEERITTRYGVGPGDIRGKVETAQWLLNAAERLAAELDLDSVHAVRRARKRVEHGVREDLLDLVGVRGVGRKRARRLFRAGIETRADLRAADKSVVLAALNGRRKTAQNILENVGHRNPEMDGVVAGDPAGGSGSGAAGTPAGGSSAGAGGAGDGPAAGTAADEADDASDDQASLGDF